MKTPFFYNRKIGILIIISPVLIFSSCLRENTQEQNVRELQSYKNSLIKTDKEFSDLSLKEGIGKAFIEYSAADVVLLRDGQFPLTGRDALIKHFTNVKNNGESFLSWEPVKADAGASGDIGYTYGNWKLTGKNKDGTADTAYGNYVTVWKRQPDGKWRFVLDGGNSTPAPGK